MSNDGIIALHGNVSYPETGGYSDFVVDVFWDEIDGEYDHEEIVYDGEEGGIGVLFL